MNNDSLNILSKNQFSSSDTSYYANRSIKSIYSGEASNGKPLGKGIKRSFNEDGSLKKVHEGTFINYKLNGKGKSTSYNEDGSLRSVKQGIFKDGVLSERTY